MDRTKEFLAIVQLSQIPQQPKNSIDFYYKIHKIKKQIDDAFVQISKVTSYESFRTIPLLKSCADLLETLRNVKINEDVSRDHLEVVQNLKSLVNTTCLTYQLRLNEIKRKLNPENKHRRNETTVNQEDSHSDIRQRNGTTGQGLSQDLLMQEHENVQEQEQTQERKRILRSITEIGQIVEDISIHVRLQEEQLKRIDDIVIKSDRWLKKTTSELRDYWDMVRSGRGRMIRYFVFFVIVVLLFWIIRKS